MRIITFSIFWSFVTVSLLTINLHAQTDLDYKRSSLHLILIDQNDFFNRNAVKTAFFKSAFPNQYDKVDLKDSILDIRDYISHMEERQREIERDQKMPGYIKSGFTKEYEIATKVFEEDEKEIKTYIEDYIKKKDLARKIVAQWFERGQDGTFSMGKIQKRGQYDASVFEAQTANSSSLGSALLNDAGENLIGNTFVVFNNLRVVDNEPFVNTLKMRTAKMGGLKRSTKLQSSKLGRGINRARLAAKKKVEKGYNVWTTAYLYKLKWNEEIQSIFFEQLWIGRGESDPERKKRFESTDLFELEFVGYSYSQSIATESLWAKQKPETIVETATLRNIENTYSKLQKENDVFKPITSITSVNPVKAKIGKKEGLEGNEKFEVLEISIDEKTGIQKLNRVDVISVDPKNIWDNRYNAAELIEKGYDTNLSGTHFKHGPKKLYPGLLMRLLKS